MREMYDREYTVTQYSSSGLIRFLLFKFTLPKIIFGFMNTYTESVNNTL